MADPITNLDQEEIVVVSRERVQKLTEDTLKVVNKRIAERIIQVISDDADETHTPSAAAVNTAIKNIRQIVNIVVASGDPADVVDEPNDKTLYTVRKAVTDKVATPYIWDPVEGFIEVDGEDPVFPYEISVITEGEIDDAVAAADEATRPIL